MLASSAKHVLPGKASVPSSLRIATSFQTVAPQPSQGCESLPHSTCSSSAHGGQLSLVLPGWGALRKDGLFSQGPGCGLLVEESCVTCLGPCVTLVQGEECCLGTKTSRVKKWRQSVLVACESKFQPPRDIHPSHLMANVFLWSCEITRFPSRAFFFFFKLYFI